MGACGGDSAISLEGFLEGVRAELASDLGITVVDGFIEGPLENIPAEGYGCVYPDETAELAENVLYEELTVRARVFLPIAQQFDVAQPADSSDLIDLRRRMAESLKDKQTQQFSVWFFRIAGFVFDPQRRFVEAVVVGRQQAEFMAGA